MSFEGKLAFFNAHHTFKIENKKLKIYLDIDNRGIIKGCSFEKSNLGDLSQEVEDIIGKSIDGKLDDLLNGKSNHLKICLYKAIEEYKGVIPTISKLKQESDQQLVCRCFGVYYSEIFSLLKEKPNLEVADITDELKAGGGCTSCIKEIKDITHNHSGEIEKVRLEKKLEAAILLWFKEFYPELLVDKEIYKSSDVIYIKIESEIDLEIKKQFRSFLEINLRSKFRTVFL